MRDMHCTEHQYISTSAQYKSCVIKKNKRVRGMMMIRVKPNMMTVLNVYYGWCMMTLWVMECQENCAPPSTCTMRSWSRGQNAASHSDTNATLFPDASLHFMSFSSMSCSSASSAQVTVTLFVSRSHSMSSTPAGYDIEIKMLYTWHHSK